MTPCPPPIPNWRSPDFLAGENRQEERHEFYRGEVFDTADARRLQKTLP